jgi:glycosyltransferase involved in cell wall biosynthesis
MVEPDELGQYQRLVNENGWKVKVIKHTASNQGIGFARAYGILLAYHWGLDAVLMVDDDTMAVKGDARRLLKLAGSGAAMAVAGWMPNYGLWLPNGNALAKEDNLCLLRASAPDRTIAFNPALVLTAGNYDLNLHAHGENPELSRCGIKSGVLWYVHTGLHIKSILKHHDPGGLNTYLGKKRLSVDAMLNQLHVYVFGKWGPRYINDPSKSRMLCKWQLMYEDFIGAECAAAAKASTVYEDKDVKSPGRMFA